MATETITLDNDDALCVTKDFPIGTPYRISMQNSAGLMIAYSDSTTEAPPENYYHTIIFELLADNENILVKRLDKKGLNTTVHFKITDL